MRIVLVYPVNILPQLRVLGDHEGGRVSLLIEPEQSQAATDRSHHADDDGSLGVGRHQAAVPVEKSLQATDDSILTAANWSRFCQFDMIFIYFSSHLTFEVKKVLSFFPGYPLM